MCDSDQKLFWKSLAIFTGIVVVLVMLIWLSFSLMRADGAVSGSFLNNTFDQLSL